MLRSLLLTACLLLSATACADDWHMITDGFSHSIVTSNAAGHQLVVDASGDAASLRVGLKGNAERAPTRWPAEVRVDSQLALQGELAFLNARGRAGIASLLLTHEQKISLLNHMIGGLQISIDVEDAGKRALPLNFSLMGFTAALNDLLIANHVGRLDFEWLLETHREQELFCLYAATLTVKAMTDRNAGRALEDTLAEIQSTGIEMLDAGVPELVAGVYRMPQSAVPREPRGEKFGLFQACLRR